MFSPSMELLSSTKASRVHDLLISGKKWEWYWKKGDRTRRVTRYHSITMVLPANFWRLEVVACGKKGWSARPKETVGRCRWIGDQAASGLSKLSGGVWLGLEEKQQLPYGPTLSVTYWTSKLSDVSERGVVAIEGVGMGVDVAPCLMWQLNGQLVQRDIYRQLRKRNIHDDT